MVKVPVWSQLPDWSKRNLAVLSTGLALTGGVAELGKVMGEGQGYIIKERANKQLACAQTLGPTIVRDRVSDICLEPIYGEFPTRADLSKSHEYLPSSQHMRDKAEANIKYAEALPTEYARTGLLIGLGVWALGWTMELSLGGAKPKTTRSKE